MISVNSFVKKIHFLTVTFKPSLSNETDSPTH